MRITRFRTTVAATLAAAGLYVSGAVSAAPLNTNLVVDPSFEAVDAGSPGPFGNPKLTQWQSNSDDAYVYAYSSGYSGPTVPPGSGDYHFAGGYGAGGLGSGHTFQNIDVSTGDSATAIATGLAKFDLSGYFSTYLTQNEFSFVEAVFLGAGNAELGRASVGGRTFGLTLPVVPGALGDNVDWGQDPRSGLLPIGTRNVRVQLSADGGATNFDGYVDNVDFRITQAAGKAGDVDLDGVVNLNDFDIIRLNFYEGTTREKGDLDFDGLVTEADFHIWKNAYGAGAPNSVPEPSSWVLLVGATLGAATYLRRRGR